MRALFLLLLLLPLSVFAAEKPVVKARLISENLDFVIAAENRVGVLLDVPKGWHIYGRTSAEIGLPTSVQFHAPESFSIRDAPWPPEEDFVFQEISGSGYSGITLLPATLRGPADVKEGEKFNLAAHVEWLVCKDVCIPESADLFLPLTAAKAPRTSSNAALFTAAPTATENDELWQSIFFAFLGGLILNLMPCVFPILSMKALGLIKKAHTRHRGHVVRGGLAYAGGVVVSFWFLAALMIALKNAGMEIGWGVQLQSPWFVATLAALLFIIAFMLADIIRIQGNFVNLGEKLTHITGHWGTFFTGALAVVVATPCTAPFMGAAMFYAFTQNAGVTLAIFTSLGLGLAAPYLFLTLFPPALHYMPKPGPWMVKLKKILALPMAAAAVWLVWVFVQQIGLFAMPHHANAEKYSAARLMELRTQSRPAFVNMTASWCITCLVNERTTLSSPEVQDLFRQNEITYLVGDWTNRAPEITRFLSEYNRVGVPLYVLFDSCGGTKILPQILTIEKMQQSFSNSCDARLPAP